MKIVMVSSEARPFCKTGGLADVVYSLSLELAKAKQEVSVIIPYYSSIKTDAKKILSFPIKMSWRIPSVEVYKTEYEGITYYLIKNDQYFSRGHLYGDFDDGERFAYFTMATFALLKELKESIDIVHIHDWQAGMLSCLIKEDKTTSLFKSTKIVGTIHNPAFQGMLPKIVLGDFYNLSDSLYESGKVRFEGQVSTLKTLIVYADKLTTVSPTHRGELLTIEGSMGLYSVLRFREFDFLGILNGIDYLEFNPKFDKNIVYEYSVNNYLKGKQTNKEELLEMFRLPISNNPIYALVTRLTWQKGFDILFRSIETLVKKNCYVVVLGSGERKYEQRLEELRCLYPKNIGIYIGYSDPIAHKIYAGSDFFLMPSLFEPCGLGQMIAQRYGTLPIVRRTGGLSDSVINYDDHNLEISNGYGFDSYDEYELERTCLYAYKNYFDKKTHHQLVKNALKTDNSWSKSMNEYMKVYLSLK